MNIFLPKKGIEATAIKIYAPMNETTAIGKNFMQNRIKSRIYFSASQYQNFRKF